LLLLLIGSASITTDLLHITEAVVSTTTQVNFMSTTTGLTFTLDDHQRPVSVKCPFCGEEMPPPTQDFEAPLAAILRGTQQFLEHESLKHPEAGVSEQS